MILSATFSKPTRAVSALLGADYIRVKIKLFTSSVPSSGQYFAEFFTRTQVFHKKMTEQELGAFIEAHAGKTFRACVQRTETEEITVLASKKGAVSELRRRLDADSAKAMSHVCSPEKKKTYILAEGIPVPFLVRLGIMTAEGKVVAAKYGKFRQINRFLECVDDILDEVIAARNETGACSEPLRIVDFGSGKSYLTFAVQYYLSTLKKIRCEIFGLDLKKDVVEYCARLAQTLSLDNLTFAVGDIAGFGGEKNPDVVITLHACDTATDYALSYAVSHRVRAILSVPCCQHEVNAQLSGRSVPADSPFAPLLKYGLIKERFSALATDAVRAELLEKNGYKTQVLEFIEDSATPKNLLIRAVRRKSADKSAKTETDGAAENLLAALGAKQTLYELLP